MQLNNIKRKTKNKAVRRIGRGGKHAKTSGRGTKGQNARAGHKKRPEIRDFIKRLPKLRGRGKNLNTPIQKKPTVISLESLAKSFKNGDNVNAESLKKAGLIRKGDTFKILGGGVIDKKLTVSGVPVSNSAKEAIEKAGGTINK